MPLKYVSMNKNGPIVDNADVFLLGIAEQHTHQNTSEN